MKRNSLSSLPLWVALGLSSALTGTTSACSSDPDDAQPSLQVPDATGQLRLALTAQGRSGSLYRLRDAFFDVQSLFDIGPVPIPIPPTPGVGVVAGAGGTAGTGSEEPGIGGAPVAFPEPIDFFSTTLSSEDDPLSSTLEATLPAGEYLALLFGNFFLEKIVDGVATPVDSRLLDSSVQTFSIAANGETSVAYRFETNGEVIEFGDGRLVIEIEVEEVEDEPPVSTRSVIEHSPLGLTGFTLRGALDAALVNSGASSSGLAAEDVYHSIIDSYATSEAGRNPEGPHCDDELTDGQPSLNGFPLQCGRLEAQQFDNLDSWFPTAVVNRLDLAPVDGSHCGQQRLVFANSEFIGNGRMFMIVEAQIPNPDPSCGVSACRPIAQFWDTLAEVEDPGERSRLLADAFLFSGVGDFGPFMNSDNLGPNGGQIRTNNFNDSPWTLREFHFQSGPDVLPLPVPVAEAPNGELWNDALPLPNGPECRESFLEAMDGLFSDNLAALSFPVAEVCKDAESPNDFFRHDYAFQLLTGTGEFFERVAERAAEADLGPLDVAARARFAGSCMGCHQEASGSSLGRDQFAPPQFDFVHVSEFLTECEDGDPCFALSEALQEVFLPHRIDVQRELLNTLGSCEEQSPPTEVPPVPSLPPLLDAGAPAEGVPVDFGAPELAPLGSARVPTLGGQIAGPHAH